MKQAYIPLILCSILASATTYASDIRLGTGSETGNYYSMSEDIQTYCEDALPDGTGIEIMPSGGSVSNLMGMNNKQFSAGVIQEDVLQFYKTQDPKRVNSNRLKIISGLHSETFHLLIPKGFKPKGNSSLTAKFKSWMSDDGPKKISIDSLKGQPIGAVGGAEISAKAMSYFMGLNLKVISINASQAKNSVAPLLIVGGQPDNLVQSLLNTKKYMLVGISGESLSSRPFYTKTQANYEIDGKLKTVETVGVRAYLLGKAFRKSQRNGGMIALAKCIDDNLEDLADDPDTNPNWTSVIELQDNGDMTNWSYFPIN